MLLALVRVDELLGLHSHQSQDDMGLQTFQFHQTRLDIVAAIPPWLLALDINRENVVKPYNLLYEVHCLNCLTP